MFSNCVCCTPALAAASASIGRRKFIAGGIAALGLGSAGAPVVRIAKKSFFYFRDHGTGGKYDP
jgi:hypothetical protein